MKKCIFLFLIIFFISCSKENSHQPEKSLTKLYIQFLPKNDFAVEITLDVKENYLLYESGVNWVVPEGNKLSEPCNGVLLILSTKEVKQLLKLYKAIDFKENRDSIAGMKTSIENISGNTMQQYRQFGSWTKSEKLFLKEVLRLASQKGNDCLKEEVGRLNVF